MQFLVDRGTDRLAVRRHDNPRADTVIVIFPAMGVPAGYYDRFAAALVGAGYEVAVADLRGTGDSTPRPTRASAYGYADLADDVGAVLESLADRRAGRRTLLLGHSLGGQACVLRLARSSASVDGLVLIGVGLPYWRSYDRRRLGVYGFTQAIAATSALLGIWPGWGFGGRQARGVIRDWGHTARHGVFPGGLGEERLAGISVPVLAISVDDDRYTPPSTTDHLTAKLTGSVVTRHHLSRDEAGVALDHFRWVKAGSAISRRIDTWLGDRVIAD
ncbi:putative alpha/beta hydrolase [Allocatelliglobosispora scoriae]|uniref:Putative alpha/beta hydrolase n=1 Tax=Allocatelliglobosispora scoriae TaxID=643052 RepID=A0A841C3P0_9ACTN|nr:alpha/beta fold hydrolase [Allocatelliglobosispora scoriae]MBB5873753.1 putative alpha/beta hydrolase [Allocatelliglobosispora scoriae]